MSERSVQKKLINGTCPRCGENSLMYLPESGKVKCVKLKSCAYEEVIQDSSLLGKYFRTSAEEKAE